MHDQKGTCLFDRACQRDDQWATSYDNWNRYDAHRAVDMQELPNPTARTHLIATPPYAYPTGREIALHALAIDRAADLPVMLYNYPGR